MRTKDHSWKESLFWVFPVITDAPKNQMDGCSYEWDRLGFPSSKQTMFALGFQWNLSRVPPPSWTVTLPSSHYSNREVNIFLKIHTWRTTHSMLTPILTIHGYLAVLGYKLSLGLRNRKSRSLQQLMIRLSALTPLSQPCPGLFSFLLEIYILSRFCIA